MKKVFSNNEEYVKVVEHYENLPHLAENAFISPHGVCLKYHIDFSFGGYEVIVELSKVSNYKIMLINPKLILNGFIINNGETNDMISVSAANFGTEQMYHVDLIVKSNNPIKTGCSTDGTMYKNCMNAHVRKKFMGYLGCLPPWLENSELTCNEVYPYNYTIHNPVNILNWNLIKGNVVSECTKE